MQVMRVINHEFTKYESRLDHPIRRFRYEQREKLESVTNSGTAIKYFNDLLDDILEFSCTNDELLSITDKSAITKTKESAEELIQGLKDLNKIVEEEKIVLTM